MPRPDSVQYRVDLSDANSFGVRCFADEVFFLEHETQLDAAMQWLSDNPNALILGAGSNILFACERVPAVLRINLQGKEIVHTPDSEFQSESQVVVHASAGENWHGLVGWTLANGLTGLENLALIPGQAGTAPVQNIGAYGVELASCLHAVYARRRSDGSAHEMTNAQCCFDYRDSIFKRQAGQWLITGIALRLTRQTHRPPSDLVLDYGDLRSELTRRGITEPSASDVADAVSAIRRRKLPDPAQLGNAGSFFKNPVLCASEVDRLQAMIPDLPSWPGNTPGTAKISAAALIEHAGLKGARDGDAGIHANHALVLVNYGQANGVQLLAMAEQVREQVATQFNVTLETEPLIIR